VLQRNGTYAESKEPLSFTVLEMINSFLTASLSFDITGYKRHLSMRFAIDEINNSTSLLPGVKLGYEIHNTCNNPAVANKPTMSFLSKYPNHYGVEVQCDYTNYKPRVVAVVGPGNSELSVLVARFLKFLLIPEISYASSSDKLSDRQLYPSFFRTVPSDRIQADAMVQLLSKFNWNWVATLVTDDEYGRRALQIFVQLALSKDMCVAYEAILPSDPEESKRKEELSKIADQLQTSNINATVIFAQPSSAEALLRVVLSRGITGKVWIASECWATSPIVAHIPNLARIGTIIGVAIKSGEMPGFREYVQNVVADPSRDQTGSDTSDGDEQCSDCSSLTLADFSTDTGPARFYSTFNTYKAVYVIAHALHQLLQCNATSKWCNMSREVYPWQLLEEVARVNFTINSHLVHFSKSGNPPTGYDLIYWDATTHGNHEFVSFGSYHPLQPQLNINKSKIRWNTKEGKPPISRCTQECKPGQKRWLRGEHNCCFLCEDCPANYFQNKNDPHECTPCPREKWSPPQSTTCYDRAFEYLEVTDTLPINMVALTVLAMAQMAVVTGILAKHRGTPAMRFVGGFPTLSIVLSSTCFCSSFYLFVIKPTSMVCKLRQPLFFFSFTISLATLLGKTLQSSGLGWTLKRPKLRKHLMGLCILLNIAIQGLLCLVWYFWNPPSLEESTELEKTILVQCRDSSFPGYSSLLAHDFGLAAVCCLCTFMGNNSDQRNDKAAKSISFAMILILIIWTLFVPTYATSQGKFVSLFQVFAGLASIFAIFGSYYYPVCYILLFAPHMNTDTHFRCLPQNPPADGKPDAPETK
uniref:G-protein coupled receptors family 3 profile domain-containing protein n=2 Tax=Podarcis muralis TaxID=64176 RepID=A0A670JF84_PODMU